MKIPDIKNRAILNECNFTSVRGSGPGGQNVNKVNTKVELRFNVIQSQVLSETEKLMILNKLRKRINKDGELIITSQTERSQFKNKDLVTERFYVLLNKALTPQKKRISTTPTLSSRRKRIENKKIQGEKKKLRNSPGNDQ